MIIHKLKDNNINHVSVVHATSIESIDKVGFISDKLNLLGLDCYPYNKNYPEEED